ncbi:type VII secretion target [Segniliparus rugosus]|uniref:Excreted virulence factor EspC, type VII ESX diderm n=1 Tax=Segniliparus rugosus (strain ATCC BAA-974 / DSM 45345 / CCUG 50838 / CIP 108380 / JCM 13579 / CDC 945) TaxID=679197 RepID=U1M2D2_SEGRC|nr:type VII secretion target [Segniliparus rugosus]ERG69255.1 hypothetical protein HMPREF9336_04146 [Segniliparus rugosus ATCC BAA-974]
MSNNAVLTVNAEELKSYASAVRGEAPAAQALAKSSAEALSAYGPALGGKAAQAAADLQEAWAAADEAYIKRLGDTADQVESSAALYEGSDDSGAHALRLVEQDGGH